MGEAAPPAQYGEMKMIKVSKSKEEHMTGANSTEICRQDKEKIDETTIYTQNRKGKDDAHYTSGKEEVGKKGEKQEGGGCEGREICTIRGGAWA